jgi:uncharacterized protein with PIN domain
MSSDRPRFIADAMLGKLARWLRILGYDAAFDTKIRDEDLIARARAEGRILLTRDTRLVLRRGMPDFLLLESQDPPEQIRQVLREFDLQVNAGEFLSRCLLCNEATVEIPREEARSEVPPYVHRTQERFARCPRCRRIYWRATHVADILERLGDVTGP